jgi:hypothetical protein
MKVHEAGGTMTTHETTPPNARRLTVTRGRHGWEVMEERDNRVVRRVQYTDWHRVERALGQHGGGLNAATTQSILLRTDGEQ